MEAVRGPVPGMAVGDQGNSDPGAATRLAFMPLPSDKEESVHSQSIEQQVRERSQCECPTSTSVESLQNIPLTMLL